MSNRESEGEPTEPESSAYNPPDRNFGGVVSGEATPPDEHTRRVAAMKKQGSAPEPTVHTVHDQMPETRTAVPVEPDPRHEQLVRDAKAQQHQQQQQPQRRSAVTHDSPTEARVPAPIKAYEKPGAPPSKPAPAPAPPPPAPPSAQPASTQPASTQPASAQPATTTTTPPPPAAGAAPADPAAVAVPAATPTAAEQPSSRHLADRSLRERRRERDRKAERAALRAVVLTFLAIGGIGIWVVNSDLLNDPEEDTTSSDPPAKQLAKRLPVKERPVTTSNKLDETPDLPALRMLARDGLTIAAEGIPEVNSSDQGQAVGVLAAIETCRFAFGVWEFSPNKRFRFLTTCEALEGQVLVGAYQVQGSVIRMSPLTDGPAQITCELEVEKPSHMTTQVNVTSGGHTITLAVSQHVEIFRAGLQGEAFRDTYAPRNTLTVPGRSPPAQQQPPQKAGGLRDLLQQPR